jgi:hypothetical protein
VLPLAPLRAPVGTRPPRRGGAAAMNTQQAKRLPLPDLLARLGFHPVKAGRGELWYRSPFRPETVPSFHVNLARNVWYDFGDGQGGNVLDFVMKHERLSTVPEALKALERICGRPPHGGVEAMPEPRTARQPRPSAPAPGATPPAATVGVLRHRALLAYLTGRRISPRLARPYVQEIHYTRQGKAYFALAFRNDSGGYELRNPYFKGTHGPKDLTLIPGQEGSGDLLAVFEGFIDFLSALACGALPSPWPPVLVLNSTALGGKALGAIRGSGAKTVRLYLDNDQSGQELTAYFRRELAGVDVVDCSSRYAGYKDFNDYLTASKRAAGS